MLLVLILIVHLFQALTSVKSNVFARLVKETAYAKTVSVPQAKIKVSVWRTPMLHLLRGSYKDLEALTHIGNLQRISMFLFSMKTGKIR